MPIDWSKPIKTRDGREARYLGPRNDGARFTKFVAIELNSGLWEVETFTEMGGFADALCDLDLMNVPEKRKVKLNLNIYEKYAVSYSSRSVAQTARDAYCLAIVEREIEYTVGEGLETAPK